MVKNILFGIGGLFVLFLVIMLLNAMDLVTLKTFGVAKQNVRREIFEETKSYNESKEQELLKYRLEYLRADADDKIAIASTIRMAFADYDENRLNPELRSFLKEIKYGF